MVVRCSDAPYERVVAGGNPAYHFLHVRRQRGYWKARLEPLHEGVARLGERVDEFGHVAA